MVLDISNEMTIRYLASKVDNNEKEMADGNSDASMEDPAGDGEGDDDSLDDDDINDDLQQMPLDVANKTNDSGFRSSFDENPSTLWTGVVPTYPVGVSAGSSSFLSSSRLAMWNRTVSGVSFDEYVQKTARWSGIDELMGGQWAAQGPYLPK